MNSREIAAEIKMRVSMRDICERYGLSMNGAGFINCPFHAGDNTASLKIYRGNKGWHCFGCGVGGSVIDFVMIYFNIDFKQAVTKIDTDFKLCLTRKPTLREYRQMQERSRKFEAERAAYAQKLSEAIQEGKRLFNEFIRLRDNKRNFAPKTPSEEWDERYIEALNKIDYTEYLLDCAEERIEVIKNERRSNQYNDHAGAAEK